MENTPPAIPTAKLARTAASLAPMTATLIAAPIAGLIMRHHGPGTDVTAPGGRQAVIISTSPIGAVLAAITTLITAIAISMTVAAMGTGTAVAITIGAAKAIKAAIRATNPKAAAPTPRRPAPRPRIIRAARVSCRRGREVGLRQLSLHPLKRRQRRARPHNPRRQPWRRASKSRCDQRRQNLGESKPSRALRDSGTIDKVK